MGGGTSKPIMATVMASAAKHEADMFLSPFHLASCGLEDYDAWFRLFEEPVNQIIGFNNDMRDLFLDVQTSAGVLLGGIKMELSPGFDHDLVLLEFMMANGDLPTPEMVEALLERPEIRQADVNLGIALEALHATQPCSLKKRCDHLAEQTDFNDAIRTFREAVGPSYRVQLTLSQAANPGGATIAFSISKPAAPDQSNEQCIFVPATLLDLARTVGAREVYAARSGLADRMHAVAKVAKGATVEFAIKRCRVERVKAVHASSSNELNLTAAPTTTSTANGESDRVALLDAVSDADASDENPKEVDPKEVEKMLAIDKNLEIFNNLAFKLLHAATHTANIIDLTSIVGVVFRSLIGKAEKLAINSGKDAKAAIPTLTPHLVVTEDGGCSLSIDVHFSGLPGQLTEFPDCLPCQAKRTWRLLQDLLAKLREVMAQLPALKDTVTRLIDESKELNAGAAEAVVTAGLDLPASVAASKHIASNMSTIAVATGTFGVLTFTARRVASELQLGCIDLHRLAQVEDGVFASMPASRAQSEITAAPPSLL